MSWALVATDGTDHLVATGLGIARVSAKKAEVLHRLPVKVRRGEDGPPPEIFLCLDADTVWLKTRGSPSQLWSRTTAKAPPTPLRCDGQVFAAVALGERRCVVAALREGKSSAGLYLATVDEAGVLEWGEELAGAGLAATRTKWPYPADRFADVPDDDGEIEVETGALGELGRSGPVLMTKNRFGIVAWAPEHAGLLVLLSPDAKTVVAKLTTPRCEPEDGVWAEATETGILVVVSRDLRHSSMVHLSAKGEVTSARENVGSEEAWSVGAPFALTGKSAWLVQQKSECLPFELDLAKGTTKLLKVAIEGHIASAAEEGDVRVIATDTPRALYVASGMAKPKLAKLLLPDFTPLLELPPVTKHAYSPRRGDPAVLIRQVEPMQWSAPAGQPLVVRFGLISSGGPGKGVYVDAGGPAMAGLVVPEKAVIDGIEAPFKKTAAGYRAEFPTWALVPEADLPDKLPFGVVAPMPKLYSMYVTLTGAKPGEALATLRIGPLSLAGTKGSALQGKSFRVLPAAAPSP
jgi:hypothetical protein